jgi:hypothetical protein
VALCGIVAESTEESLGKGTLTKLAALPVACLTSHVIVLAAVPIAPLTSPFQFVRFPCPIVAWKTIEAIVLEPRDEKRV